MYIPEKNGFGISFRGNLRSRSALPNPLESNPGIGSRTPVELLGEIKTANRVYTPTEEQLSKKIRPEKARAMFTRCHPGDTDAHQQNRRANKEAGGARRSASVPCGVPNSPRPCERSKKIGPTVTAGPDFPP
jgi:hypothetical protein